MSRFLIVAAAALLGAQISGVAQASTVQYDLTLTPTVGSIGGSGYLDVAAPLNGSGINNLTDFSVAIDGQTFTLANDPTASATFYKGMLTSINYVGALISGLNLDILGTGGLSYTFLDIGTGATVAAGSIYAVDPPPGVSATPLPTTIVMFATGLLGLAFLMYRRKAPPAFKIA